MPPCDPGGRRHAQTRRLEMVVLNGCDTLELGQMCCDHGVPTVVCWSTKLEDKAAYLFVRGFFRSIRRSLDQNERSPERYHSAFAVGKEAVTGKKRLYKRTDGEVEEVPYFALRDPRSGAWLNGSLAAGIPEIVQRGMYMRRPDLPSRVIERNVRVIERNVRPRLI